MDFDIGKYRLELKVDETYSFNSMDNNNHYQKEYFDESEDDFPTRIGLKIFQKDQVISSAIIASVGGHSNIHQNSQIIKAERILVTCSDSIFCLAIPDLQLIWKTQADQVTCFGIFAQENSYIVHGEIEISKLDLNGKLIWQQSGEDIFITDDGMNNFEISYSYIKVTDWGNRVYKFDHDGNRITE